MVEITESDQEYPVLKILIERQWLTLPSALTINAIRLPGKNALAMLSKIGFRIRQNTMARGR